MSKLEKWSDYLPAEELATYAKGKFGERIGFGKRVALLNIDTTLMFVDPAYPQCGDGDPELVENITRLVANFRKLELPIYYSRRDDRSHPIRRGMWNDKLGIADDVIYSRDPRADEWPDAYAPREQDVVVYKNKASCFFGTPLEAFLRYDGIDTIVICGISTSGCVRAAANDAFSHNFRVIIAEEAVGDRSQTAHRANLFDMDMKMGDVEPLESVITELHQRYGAAMSNPC
ncbi:MAG: isochorismatase family protein [Methyloligellaceae bacterium]